MLPSRKETSDVDFVVYSTDQGDQVTVKGAGRCGERSCVVCSLKIAHHRAKETTGWLEAWFAAGGSAAYWCLTVPRVKAENPDAIHADLRRMISAPFTGKARAATMARVGAEVYPFTGLEVTTGITPDGRADMHPHLHGLMLIASNTPAAMNALYSHLLRSFVRHSDDIGRPIHILHGFVFKPLTVDEVGTIVGLETLSEYVHKGAGFGVAMEIHGEAYKVGKVSGERYNVAQLLGLFEQTGDLEVLGAYRSMLHFMSGKRAWIKPTKWVDTLAFASAHGVAALNGQDRALVLAEGERLVAAEKEALEPRLPIDGADDPLTSAAGRELTDEEIANAEVEGGMTPVSVGWQLWTWICLRRGALGACVDVVRTAPVGQRAEYLCHALAALGCPDGLRDCIIDREHEDIVTVGSV